jgi:hypothetical protein
VKFIEVQVGDEVFRARLDEEAAPETCATLWNALPFGGRAVHAQVSGEMFRMFDHAPFSDLAVESGSSFQYPGAIGYCPQVFEIAICYGQARFGSENGPVELTPFAEIEGDPARLARRAATLRDTGALAIEFRQAVDQRTPFQAYMPAGRSLTVEYGNAQTSATLLDEVSPITAAAVAALLPLPVTFIADNWGGHVSHAALDGASLSVTTTEATSRLLWPGYVYYSPDRNELSLCYGGAALHGPREGTTVIPLAALGPTWRADLLATARGHLFDGKRVARISLA